MATSTAKKTAAKPPAGAEPVQTTQPTAPGFNHRQVAQLLAPVAPSRVMEDGKGHSHLSQQDVTAHLIRVFGFGNFDVDTLDLSLVFETPRDQDGRRWDVCYRARVRLTIRDESGGVVCHYEDGSTGMAQNQTRGDAHDLAMKSALSLAKKRAAINLGDQFGLSLYNKGQLSALVRGTLVAPAVPAADDKPAEDVQAGVPEQVALGHAETEAESQPPAAAATQQRAPQPAQAPGGERQQGRASAPVNGSSSGPDAAVVKAHTIAAAKAADLPSLRSVWDQACEAGTVGSSIPDPDSELPAAEAPRVTLGDFITRRREAMTAANPAA